MVFCILSFLNNLLSKTKWSCLIPKEFKWYPPTDRYSISRLFSLSLDITVEASLSPEGSPVRINIFL